MPQYKWANFEKTLCAIFCFSRIALFAITLLKPVGFDYGAHISIVNQMCEGMTLTYDGYYSSHPPLAFLLAAWIKSAFHLPTVEAIQIVSGGSMLISFYFLRRTLAALHFLDDPRAILFLYLVSSLPLQVYLCHGINIESVLMAEASAILYLSVCIRRRLQIQPAGANDLLNGSTVLLALVMALALITKASALLLLPLPVLICCTICDTACLKRGLRTSISGILIGLALAAPWYTIRSYVVAQPALLPTARIYQPSDIAALKERNENPFAFLARLSLSEPKFVSDLGYHNQGNIRLQSTWRDMWYQDRYLGRFAGAPVIIAGFYYVFCSVFFLTGSGLFVLAVLTDQSPWVRFGISLFSFAAIQLVGLIVFCFCYPTPAGDPAKAMYVAPSTWFIAYALTANIGYWPCNRLTQLLLGLIIVPFMLCNHLVPIY
ncbi:MAG TPA: hypothetical protein V6C81_06285 [Planktothrix sp.]